MDCANRLGEPVARTLLVTSAILSRFQGTDRHGKSALWGTDRFLRK